VAVSGPSGCGKTSLLRAIADLDPHYGRVFLDGVECTAFVAPEWRRRVGLLLAESGWWSDRVGDHFTVRDPLATARLGFGPEVFEWPVARLSTGERQRLALLRLLGNRPVVLLLDEPTANLDPASASNVESLLAEYREEMGAAVVWITHDVEQSRRIAEQRLWIEAGRLVRESVE
jgi:ABC-type iron transport system FetAB ATPase subunit